MRTTPATVFAKATAAAALLVLLPGATGPRPPSAATAALADTNNVVVEEHPLVVTYESVAGGAIKKGQEDHLRNQTELILLVHRSGVADQTFTCNKRVVPGDINGHSRGVMPHAKQIVSLQALPAGAPNGGSRSFFPPAVAKLLVGRFTNVEDTVLGIGVETTTVAEAALEKGRPVEFYVMDEDKRGVRLTKISSSFRSAHSAGHFKSRGGKEVWVGPKTLPSGLPNSTVPERITTLVNESKSPEDDDDNSAFFKAAKHFAKDCQYDLKGDTDKSKAQLVVKKRRTSRSSGKYRDILLWGDLIVYTSPDEAIASLSSDDVDDQRIRLVEIADNAQLRIMLEAGVELCGAGAALYLRVDPSCPIYWVRWDTPKTNADLDIVCGIPHRGSRDSVFALVHVKPDGTGGVRVRHARNKPTESSAGREQQRPLLVYSGCGRIVGTREFVGRPSTRGDGSGEEEEKDEEEET